MATVLCFFLCIMGAFSIPLDEPIRIDLPVYDQPLSTSNVRLNEPIAPENHPGSGNDIPPNEKSVTNIFSNTINSSPPVGSVNYGGGPFSDPVTKLEGALLETEGFASKTLSVKENVQNAVAGVFQPKPIVDTIREDEKYGNSGDKFESVGRAVVGGAEGISNFLNSILEVPSRIFRTITRAASEKLNNLGGKLVGL